jgi:hypothetical protein
MFLAGTEAALALGSGMAAITSTLLTLLKAGDHMLIQRAAYGGTYDLVHHQLKDLGISASMIDISAATDSWKPLLQPNTKVGRSLRIDGHVISSSLLRCSVQEGHTLRNATPNPQTVGS